MPACCGIAMVFGGSCGSAGPTFGRAATRGMVVRSLATRGSPWLGDVDPLSGDTFAAELVHADAEHPRPAVVARRPRHLPSQRSAGPSSSPRPGPGRATHGSCPAPRNVRPIVGTRGPRRRDRGRGRCHRCRTAAGVQSPHGARCHQSSSSVQRDESTGKPLGESLKVLKRRAAGRLLQRRAGVYVVRPAVPAQSHPRRQATAAGTTSVTSLSSVSSS